MLYPVLKNGVYSSVSESDLAKNEIDVVWVKSRLNKSQLNGRMLKGDKVVGVIFNSKIDQLDYLTKNNII